MAKEKTIYVCQNCGAEYSKWLGRCSSCNSWNTIVEEVVQKVSSRASASLVKEGSAPQRLNEIKHNQEQRVSTAIGEFNRVLGGGLVKGSLVLVGGEPGIGKSTLALQLALNISTEKVLYISGEESLEQIKLRAERIKHTNDTAYFVNETSIDSIISYCQEFRPDLVIIDSIQTISSVNLDSAPGSVSQVRECTAALLRYAKSTSTTILLIGHITKDGYLAGPKALEHIVDVVLQFEGDQQNIYRLLRANKNRFGSTSELGIFEMQSEGLREIVNPSEILISPNEEKLSGISIAVALDGIRPFLIEVQSLVSTAAYGTPQRSSTGFDTRRLNMLLAVLEKRAGFKLSVKDVFLNITGGIKVDDPAMDLAVVTAVLSSNLDIYVEHNYCFAGEVGLSGEIRPVSRIDQRVREAEKLGFKKIFISKSNTQGLGKQKFKIEVIPLGKIEHLFYSLFRKQS
ncbi:MAG TPA: DNA repair protein RadA [Bacteroidales bacterium]|nr:DNA repair protein RadA [Bacteroidales bacterium]